MTCIHIFTGYAIFYMCCYAQILLCDKKISMDIHLIIKIHNKLFTVFVAYIII